MALIATSFTLGIVAPNVLSHLEWVAYASLVFATLASVCWYLSRRWHVSQAPGGVTS